MLRRGFRLESEESHEPAVLFLCLLSLIKASQWSRRELHHRHRLDYSFMYVKAPTPMPRNWLVEYSILTYFVLSIALLLSEDDDGLCDVIYIVAWLTQPCRFPYIHILKSTVHKYARKHG